MLYGVFNDPTTAEREYDVNRPISISIINIIIIIVFIARYDLRHTRAAAHEQPPSSEKTK